MVNMHTVVSDQETVFRIMLLVERFTQLGKETPRE